LAGVAFQPYRKSAKRQPGAVLSAMLRGKPTYLPNPMDPKRAMQRRKKRRPAR
jgi:hypothetical protein